MSTAAPRLGVATPSAAPAPPGVPAALPVQPPAPLVAPESTAWPRSAQVAVAALAALALLLLGWHGYARSRWATRPLALATGNEDLFRVNVNTADVPVLMQLPQCGESLARRIVEDRVKNGPFRSVNDLRRVSGVGPSHLERWRYLLYVAAAEGEDDPEPSPEPAERPPVVRASRPEAEEKAPARPGHVKKPLAVGERINVNRASADELQRLDGVGPVLAARIVEARQDKPFRGADDLKRVHGIGAKTLEKLRPHVSFD